MSVSGFSLKKYMEENLDILFSRNILYSFMRYAVLSIFSHINGIVTHWPDKRWLSHGMCLYQVIMTFQLFE